MKTGKIIYILVGIFATTAFTNLDAQSTYHRCSSMEYLNAQLAADPGLAAQMLQIEQYTKQYTQIHDNAVSRSVITIPVVVHVLYKTAAQNISDALIQAQINQLNLDYARLNSDASNTPSAFARLATNTNIQFCLAQRDPAGNPTTGIIRKPTTVTSFTTNDAAKYSSTGGDDAWSSSSYLNLWSCNLGGGLLGYAQFPGGASATDGVVLLYSSIGSLANPGTATPYNFGRTATHEIGHWLNLYHIWGDDNGACTGTDNVNDTPNQSCENYGRPAFPHTDNCTAVSPGVMFMDYMDYTDDGAMNMFTQGQVTRMNALFAPGGAKASILNSLGCVRPTVTSCSVPARLSTTNITTSSATFNWGVVSGAKIYNVQYRKTGTTSWSKRSNITTSFSVPGLTAATNYEWQVQTICSTGSSAFSGSANFITANNACVDNYEPNNSTSVAKAISINADVFGLISSSGDLDYFKFTTTAPNTNFQVSLSGLPVDCDIRLYNASGVQLSISQNGGFASELIKRNTSSGATYFVQVYGYNGAYNSIQCYDLKVSASSTAFRFADSYDEENESNVEIIDEPEIPIKLYPNPAQNNITIEFTSNTEGTAKLNVYNLSGKKVIADEIPAEEGFNTQEVNTNTLGNGVYIFEVENNGMIQRRRFSISK